MAGDAAPGHWKERHEWRKISWLSHDGHISMQYGDGADSSSSESASMAEGAQGFVGGCKKKNADKKCVDFIKVFLPRCTAHNKSRIHCLVYCQKKWTPMSFLSNQFS